ncbi:hypothetical protein HD554DRAFT_2039549 [Boletus coccyginus]|nr:hypothetical protein HD554DRAFT_2039549 [Boletus coccyginus]
MHEMARADGRERARNTRPAWWLPRPSHVERGGEARAVHIGTSGGRGQARAGRFARQVDSRGKLLARLEKWRTTSSHRKDVFYLSVAVEPTIRYAEALRSLLLPMDPNHSFAPPHPKTRTVEAFCKALHGSRTNLPQSATPPHTFLEVSRFKDPDRIGLFWMWGFAKDEVLIVGQEGADPGGAGPDVVQQPSFESVYALLDDRTSESHRRLRYNQVAIPDLSILQRLYVPILLVRERDLPHFTAHIAPDNVLYRIIHCVAWLGGEADLGTQSRRIASWGMNGRL